MGFNRESVMNDISVTSSVATAVYRGSSPTSVSDSGSLSASHKSESTVDSAFKVATSSQNSKDDESVKKLSEDDVKSAVALGNSLMQSANRNVEFQIDKATDQLIIKIVDKKSGELIRQIPSVEMLDFIKKMQALETDLNTFKAKA